MERRRRWREGTHTGRAEGHLPPPATGPVSKGQWGQQQKVEVADFRAPWDIGLPTTWQLRALPGGPEGKTEREGSERGGRRPG